MLGLSFLRGTCRRSTFTLTLFIHVVAIVAAVAVSQVSAVHDRMLIQLSRSDRRRTIVTGTSASGASAGADHRTLAWTPPLVTAWRRNARGKILHVAFTLLAAHCVLPNLQCSVTASFAFGSDVAQNCKVPPPCSFQLPFTFNASNQEDRTKGLILSLVQMGMCVRRCHDTEVSRKYAHKEENQARVPKRHTPRQGYRCEWTVQTTDEATLVLGTLRGLLLLRCSCRRSLESRHYRCNLRRVEQNQECVRSSVGRVQSRM